MNHRLLTSCVGLILLAGCASPSIPLSTSGGATLSVRPVVSAGGYRTQTLLHAYTQADIYHLQIKLFNVQANGTEIPVLAANNQPLMLDVPNASLSVSVEFTSLHQNTTYRIRAYAYSDPATASLISTTDAGSYVDVTVGMDDRPTMANLPVQMINQIFSGEATASGVTVSSGSLIYAGSASIGLTQAL